MPVRGHGWYKRPYRIIGTDAKGRRVHYCYHWPGPRDERLRRLRLSGWDVRGEEK
jgi:hypothetical protein